MDQYDNYKPTNIDWINEIPAHWSIKRLKRFAKICNGQDQKEVVCEEGQYPIYGSGGKFGRANAFLHTGPSVLLGRKGTIDKPQFTEQPFWSVDTAYYTDIFPTTNPRFFYFACLTIDFNLYKYGSAVPSMTQEALNQIPFSCPPLNEQAAIATYLDEKTEQIDTLIDRKRRLIDLLKEEKAALINEAVTKGIDPNVQMKDSGIEWLGDIPAHWTPTKVGYLATVVRGASPRPAGDPLYFSGDHTPWITVAEVTKDDNKYITSVTDYLTELGAAQSRFIEEGTLLLSNSGATLGVPKILKIGGCINDGSVAFLDLSNRVSIDFLYYYFKSLTQTFREMMSGYGQPNLNTDIVKSTPFGLPPLSEQDAIVHYIDIEIARIDHTLNLVDQEIRLMQEYRTALISEVVTGKLKVV